MKAIKTPVPTPFEQAQQLAKEGKFATPRVSYGTKNVDYFGYALATHRFNLNIMAGGMTFRGIKLKDIKNYYGLKGKSAKDCLVEFDVIYAEYKENLAKSKETEK